MIESLKKQQPLRKRGKGNRKLASKREAKGSEGKGSPGKSSNDESRPRRDRGASNPRGALESHRHHFLGLMLGSLGALTLLALVSEAGPRWAGPLGHRAAAAVLRPLGLLSFCLPMALGFGAAMLLGLVQPTLAVARRALAMLGGSAFGLLFLAVVRPTLALYGWPIAGLWVSTAAGPIAAALSPVGGGLLAFTLAFACFSVVTNHALSHALVTALKLLGRVASAATHWGHGALSTALQEHREARAQREEPDFDRASLAEAAEEEVEKRANLITLGKSPSGAKLVFDPAGDPAGSLSRDSLDDEWREDDQHEVARSQEPPEILTIGEDGRVRTPRASSDKPGIEPIALLSNESPAEEITEPPPVAFARTEPEIDPQIVATREKAAPKRKRGGAFALQRSGAGFKLPGLDLLELPPDITQDIDRNALTETAQKLTQKLADFGIKGRVETIRPGPVITMYEFVPAPGIRVSKIASLADDLAMAMEALQVRIVAPIPGKSVVGIEVPNRQRQKVFLREILEDDGFAKMNSPLTLAFGKDTEGSPYVGDLTRMPHLLVAGTTGSGKSVSMNSMIMSLLFKASPEDVRLIMIDPKMVELSMYDGIPHLLLPVVQDAQKAPLALKWAVDEMERRYHLIGKLKVKDLKAYNEKLARLKQGEKLEEPPDEPPKKILVIDVANGETEEEALARLSEQGQSAEPTDAIRDGAPRQAEGIDPSELEKLPYIVIIIDELADLMMVASRDVEQSIARLAAKARAAGIHLVIATQRPSTDVISGVIKSNLPVRVAFRLASRHDSATIINGPGAERLLGEGDMLHIPPGCSDPLRLHGAWLRESEIERVVDFWKAQGKPVYDEEILRPRSDEREDGAPESVPDELYDQALSVVCQLDRVSISLLQRKMAVGYNRAADLIERMEREGVIGPANGIKPREVLIKPVGEARI